LAAVSAVEASRPVAAFDRTGALPGRGAYVCREEHRADVNRNCLKLATARGVLQRAFRQAVDVPTELLGSLESDTRVAQPDSGPASRAPQSLIS
jgi:predicted RNA-binding protein YlxR (DUF448 family)